jgi:autotransporter-associated beta strand protein
MSAEHEESHMSRARGWFEWRNLAVGLAVIGVWAGSGSGWVRAADLTWNGGLAGTWQDGAAGWLDGVTPVAWNSTTPDAATFSGTTPLSVTVDAGGITAAGLTVTADGYSLNGPGALTVNGIIEIADGATLVAASPLAGSSGLVKDGDGTLSLTNANNTYTGVTEINGGAIRVFTSSPGVLGATATQQVTLAGGRLEAQFAANTTPTNTLLVDAAGGTIRNLGNDDQRWIINGSRISGSGVLTVSFGANNTRYQILSGQNNFSGKWIVDSGGSQNRYIDVFSSTAFGGATGTDAITLANAGTLVLRPDITLGGTNQGIYLAGGQARIGVVGNATATVAAAISGPGTNALALATDNANSVLVLDNPASDWLGETTLTGSGTVRLGQPGVLPDLGRNLVINSAPTLDLNGHNETIPGLFGSGNVDSRTAGEAVLTTGGNNESPTFSGAIRNTGSGASVALVKTGAGIQTLSGTNTYAGFTRVEGGILLLSGQGSIAQSTGITVVAGAVLSANTRADGTLTIAGIQTLTGDGAVRGNVTNLGAVAAGLQGTGRLIITGQYAQATSGSLRIDVINGSGSALEVTGPATLNGGLDVVVSGTEPTAGTTLNAMTASSRSGTFASTNLPALSGGLGWEVSYSATSVLLTVTSAVPTTGFAAWAAAITNGLTGPTDFATGDGYPNLLKYATGSSPTESDDLAHLSASLAGTTLSLVFNRNTNATDVLIVVEGSDRADNAALWTGIATNLAGLWSGAGIVETGTGNPVRVSVPAPAVPGSNRFLRLSVAL